MRSVRSCLATAMALVALVAGGAAAAKDASSTEVPPLVAAAHAPCTVTGSRFIGEGTLADKSSVKSYEVACQEGMGYVLIAKTKGAEPPNFFDCLTASQPGADGKPGPMACKLPANVNPIAGLQPIIDKTGRLCPIDKARSIGSSPDKNYYELACKTGEGMILATPRTAGGAPAVVNSCLAFSDTDQIKCQLTTRVQQLAVIDPLVAASGQPCMVKDKRYVLTTPTDETYYEVVCTNGKGFMISSNSAGKFNQAIACAQAAGVGGGCTLSDARQAETEESALYSKLAKKAGFDCQVAKYGVFPNTVANRDVVEMQCANRPDGAIGVFPSNGAPQVFDCIRSQNQGYRCSMTPESAVYGKLSAQLKARNRPSCVASGARPFGRTANTDLVEVACADGGSGWVLEYPIAASDPSGLFNCAQAAATFGHACELPTNKKS